MGMAYPMYELDLKIINKVLELVNNTIIDNFPENKRANITFRPIRPEEINDTLTADTRIYDSTTVGKTFERILGATTDFKVKTGSVYLFFGWISIIDPSAPFDFSASLRLKVDTVTRNEISPVLVNQMENNALLTLDQAVVVGPDSAISIEIKNPTSGAGAHGIIYPLAYRIGPKAQLDVS